MCPIERPRRSVNSQVAPAFVDETITSISPSRFRGMGMTLAVTIDRKNEFQNTHRTAHVAALAGALPRLLSIACR